MEVKDNCSDTNLKVKKIKNKTNFLICVYICIYIYIYIYISLQNHELLSLVPQKKCFHILSLFAFYRDYFVRLKYPFFVKSFQNKDYSYKLQYYG
jgi:hypothetical protein